MQPGVTLDVTANHKVPVWFGGFRDGHAVPLPGSPPLAGDNNLCPQQDS